jgi:hypothetical protein
VVCMGLVRQGGRGRALGGMGNGVAATVDDDAPAEQRLRLPHVALMPFEELSLEDDNTKGCSPWLSSPT